MKVLFVSNDPNIFIEGSSVRARMLAYAEAIGTLHIVGRGPRTETSTVGSLTTHSISVHKLFATSILPKKINALILQEEIEVVSAQDPFEYGLIAQKAVVGTSAKFHVQVHTDVFSPWFTAGPSRFAPYAVMPALNRVRQNIADQTLPKADGIRVVSERIKISLMERYGNRIVEPVVIPIAPPGELPPAVELPDHGFTFSLIAVGRLEPEKRFEDLFTAFMYVKDRYPTIGIYVVGEGRERARLEKIVRTLTIEDRVVFLGERTDAWGLMRSANVFVQTSAYEGYGRTIIEAALARIPIITTDVGIVGEVFKGYEDVLSTPPADPSGFSFNIVRVLESFEDRLALIDHAEVSVRAHLASVSAGPADIAADLARLLTTPTIMPTS
jgi:glycosyltransferase involved in cell wall biosynthesis